MPPYILPESLLSDPSMWHFVVPFLTERIGLPDLSSRHGLRRAYSQFERIHKELDTFHQLAKTRNSTQLLYGVVSILVKMCADSILKEKLFQRGLIDKLMDLLDHDLTRYMGLQLLLVFSHDGCRTQGVVLNAIGKQSQTLLRMIRSHPDDHKVADLALVVMAHSIRFLMASAPSTFDQPTEEPLRWREVLQSAYGLLRGPHPSRLTVTHSLMLLLSPVQYIPAKVKHDIALNVLLVALLRAQEIVTRATAMEGMLVLSQVDSGPDSYKVDLQRLARSLDHPQPPPAALNFVTSDDYPRWLQQSDSALLHRLSTEYVNAMSQAVRDRDLPSLGRAVADIVQRAPLVVDGSWEELEKRGGQHAHPRLPFSLWSDALPECASALRLTGTTSDRDIADTLDMKYLLLRDHKTEAMALAKMTMQRNPGHTFACYVLSLGGDMEEGLRAARQGLRCPELTPFLRKQMLWRAVELEVWQGFEELLTADIGDKHAHEKGVALLRAAYEHTETFLGEASPDAHLRVTMLGWSMLLTFLLCGSELSDNLNEIQHLRQQIDTSTALLEYLGFTIHKTRIHEARDRILQLNEQSLHEWGALIARCDHLNASVLCLGTGEEHEMFIPTTTGEESTPEVCIGMQRCSWCGALSATLKRCKGCGEVSYCDANCQRPHWVTHKQTCNRR